MMKLWKDAGKNFALISSMLAADGEAVENRTLSVMCLLFNQFVYLSRFKGLENSLFYNRNIVMSCRMEKHLSNLSWKTGADCSIV